MSVDCLGLEGPAAVEAGDPVRAAGSALADRLEKAFLEGGRVRLGTAGEELDDAREVFLHRAALGPQPRDLALRALELGPRAAQPAPAAVEPLRVHYSRGGYNHWDVPRDPEA